MKWLKRFKATRFPTISAVFFLSIIFSIFPLATPISASASYEAVISDSSPIEGEYFGSSVAISADGTTAVIGAYDKKIAVGSGYQYKGAAFVTTYDGSVWPTPQLLAWGESANDQFGWSVAISGDGNTIVVGAHNKTIASNSLQGAAYVFTRSSEAWNKQQLLASDGAAYDNFGESVTISTDGDTIVIGASGEDYWKGAAYIFNRVEATATYSETQKLTLADGVIDDYFGSSVAIGGDKVVVGAYDRDDTYTNQGAAYVFTNDGSTWGLTGTLTASDGAAYDNFGLPVAINPDGTNILAGAYNRYSYEGAAYVFNFDGTSWIQKPALYASDGVPGDYFGYSVAINGNTALIGAVENGDGAAYVFTSDGSTWSQNQELTVTGTSEFGSAVAACDTRLIIGAQYNTILGDSGVGTVYIYSYSGPTTTYTINASAGFNGSITPSGDVSVAAGGNQTFTISADEGYIIDQVTVDDVVVATKPGTVFSRTFNSVGADHTISATFASGYQVSVSIQTPGTGTVFGDCFNSTTNSGYYYSSETVGLTVNPAAGYALTWWQAGATPDFYSSNEMITVSSGSPHFFIVRFDPTYTITASYGTGGVISPSGTTIVQVVWDASYHLTYPQKDFTITANTGYEIADVLVDGTSKGAVGSYSFGSLTVGSTLSNHTISASFRTIGEDPLDQIQAIESDFTDCIDDGSLSAVNSGKSGAGQLNAFRNMLERAESLITQGDYTGAIQQLNDAYLKCDGLSKPPDTIQGQGTARADLAEAIQNLIDYLNTLL